MDCSNAFDFDPLAGSLVLLNVWYCNGGAVTPGSCNLSTNSETVNFVSRLGQRCEEFGDGKLRHLRSVATLARAWIVAGQYESPPSGEGSYEKMLHSVLVFAITITLAVWTLGTVSSPSHSAEKKLPLDSLRLQSDNGTSTVPHF